MRYRIVECAVYFVEADSPEQARDAFHDNGPEVSEPVQAGEVLNREMYEADGLVLLMVEGL